MNPKRLIRRTSSWLLLVLLWAGCSHATDVSQIPADELYAQGELALRNRKWSDAVLAFERFTLQFPTHPRVAEARFRLGEAHFGRKEYITAATEFSRLAMDYPAGPWADDARFKVCESYARLSPKRQLDQQYTIAALDHCQALEAYYPDSEYLPRATALAKEMLNKLGMKEFDKGEHYYKRGAIDSAIIYFESTAREFPETDAAPESLYRLFQAYTRLGYKEEADAAKAKLLKDYPESNAAKRAQ